MTLTKNLLALALLGSLFGCGGGDDAPPASSDLSDKYVGTWRSACSGPATITATGEVVSSRQTATISKVSANSYALLAGNVSFVGAGCTGTGTPVAGESLSTVFTIVGTKSVAGVTVDKITSPVSGSATAKNISYVNPVGPTLQMGKTTGSVDADGFPDELDPLILTK